MWLLKKIIVHFATIERSCWFLGVLIQPSHSKLCHCSAAGSVYLLIYGRVFRADSNCERKPFLFSVSNKLFQITFNTLVYWKSCKSLVWPKLRFLRENHKKHFEQFEGREQHSEVIIRFQEILQNTSTLYILRKKVHINRKY